MLHEGGSARLLLAFTTKDRKLVSSAATQVPPQKSHLTSRLSTLIQAQHRFWPRDDGTDDFTRRHQGTGTLFPLKLGHSRSRAPDNKIWYGTSQARIQRVVQFFHDGWDFRTRLPGPQFFLPVLTHSRLRTAVSQSPRH